MKKLGLGCMRFPLLDKNDQKSFDYPQVEKMVDMFMDHGFTYFDTAYLYHNYESERLVKKVLVDRYPRESFILATKMPTMLLTKKEDMERIFSEQLEKTGAGYFDYYLVHALNEKFYSLATELETFQFVKEKLAEKLVRKMGFSFHDGPELLEKILTEHPEVSFVQLQINYLDWESENVKSRECYEVARRHGKEIIVMEPVKGGALANVPAKAKKMFFDRDENMSVASWALRFAASLEGVIMVLSGMSNLAQMEDNISFMGNFNPLKEEEFKLCLSVGDVIKASVNVPCTSCRYCVENCPQNILIPDYFSLYNKALEKENVDFSKVKDEYERTSTSFGKASDCITCRVCEEKCPQKIKIADFMKNVKNTFEE